MYEKPYYRINKCKICCKRILQSSFAKHLRFHMKDFQEFCKTCNMGFDTHRNYKNHMKIHLSMNGVQSHSQTADTESETEVVSKKSKGTITCRFCQLSFKSYYKLRKHHRLFHPKNDFNDYGFGQKPDQNYNNDYIGDIPLTEEIIKEKGYSMEQVLMCHKIINNIWQCKICEKVLCNREGLKAHLRLHTGEFVVRCNKCDKGFTRGWHLKTHALTCGQNLRKVKTLNIICIMIKINFNYINI